MHTGNPSGPRGDQAVPRPAATSPSDAQALAAFNARLNEYTALHEKLDRTLPPLSNQTDSKARGEHQQAIMLLMTEHRRGAKPGDLFTPEGERVIRRLLAQVFSGPEGAKLKSSIMDENQVVVKLAVNGRYPDEVPVSTMPPQVLAVLPKLPRNLEFRFMGARLVLLDVHAHTVADYIENVLPQ